MEPRSRPGTRRCRGLALLLLAASLGQAAAVRRAGARRPGRTSGRCAGQRFLGVGWGGVGGVFSALAFFPYCFGASSPRPAERAPRERAAPWGRGRAQEPFGRGQVTAGRLEAGWSRAGIRTSADQGLGKAWEAAGWKLPLPSRFLLGFSLSVMSKEGSGGWEGWGWVLPARLLFQLQIKEIYSETQTVFIGGC